MKIGYTIQDFREKLKVAIYESCVNSKVQDEIIKRIAERGYDLGFISGVLEGNVTLDSLSLTDIGVFAQEIYETSRIENINPLKYLTDVELEVIKNYKKETKDNDLEYPVVFEDVRQVMRDIWTVIVPAKFIAELGYSNMLNYEFETQREAKVIETEEGIILTPTVNADSVVEIEEKLLTGTFISNELTFNLPFADRDNFKWDAKAKRWTLLKGKLNIIDGYHRYLAITSAIRKKDIGYNFVIRLTNFDDDKARRFIVQQDKQNPISKEYIKSIDESDLVTQIINQLNENTKSDFRGKITTDRTSIKKGYALVSFELLHKTIDKLWNPKSTGEVDEIFDYLRMFYNRLVYLYPEEFRPKEKSIVNDYTLSNERMFVIYTMLAKKLQNEDDWREELSKYIKNINLDNKKVKEFIEVPYSRIIQRFNRNFKLASDIVEVIING
mgnify:CR=1 FL=1